MFKNPVSVITKKDFQFVIPKPTAGELVTLELEEIVSAANGRCRRFVYSAEDLIKLALKAEDRLESARLSEAQRPGFTVSVRPAGPSNRRYRYDAAARIYHMRRTKKGWILTGIEETRVSPLDHSLVEYTATEKQAIEIAKRSISDVSSRKIEVNFV